MERSDDVWGLAQGHAHGFLRRFQDLWTRAERDDLTQDAVVAAWQWAGSVRDPGRLGAAVRTIARRLRCRGLHQARRRRDAAAMVAQLRQGAQAAQGASEAMFLVAGRRVPSDWLRDCLARVLGRMSALDRQLLLGLHEGFCCAELAARFRRSESSVKARIHRARLRVQREIEDVVRGAADLEVF